MKENFISTLERDAFIPLEIVRIIDAAYQAEEITTLQKATDAIVAFSRQLELEFTRPTLKHSMYWHKLCCSSPEHNNDTPAPAVINAIDTKITEFVNVILSQIVNPLSSS